MTGGESHGRSRHGPPCTLGPDGGSCARCAGFTRGNEHAFEQGNEAAVKAGVRSPRRLRPVADEQYRAFRASLGSAWDPAYEIAARSIASARARLILLEAYIDEHGLVDEHGDLAPAVREIARWESQLAALLREFGATLRARVEIERERAVRDMIDRGEAQAAVRALVLASAAFVPTGQREEWFEAIEAATSGIGTRDDVSETFELPPGDFEEDADGAA